MLVNLGVIIEIYKDDNGNRPKSTNCFRITDFGKKTLEDYFYNRKYENKQLWLKNAWIPIIVAFVTTLLTNFLIPMLPQILGWLSDILS